MFCLGFECWGCGFGFCVPDLGLWWWASPLFPSLPLPLLPPPHCVPHSLSPSLSLFLSFPLSLPSSHPVSPSLILSLPFSSAYLFLSLALHLCMVAVIKMFPFHFRWMLFVFALHLDWKIVATVLILGHLPSFLTADSFFDFVVHSFFDFVVHLSGCWWWYWLGKCLSWVWNAMFRFKVTQRWASFKGMEGGGNSPPWQNLTTSSMEFQFNLLAIR